ncbi:MAG TPA: Gfo/Idh/MocA family oxidoreductase [Gemmatimonadaceae bacterium]|nr:Gfo/Idh/MocA family oxidoreductase [Gemmatimonadaceae bacterium]
MIRVGLIGYGLGGEAFHAPFIAATPEMELAAIVTRDEGRRARARERYPDATLVDEPEALWTRGLVDLVVITTSNRAHAPLARAAIEAGMSVVIDKPMAVNAADALDLVKLAADRQVMLTVYQNRRWDGDFLTLRRLLREGALGTIHRFESRFERWRPTPRGDWRERGDPAEGGGVLLDLGSHLIDQALELFGPVAQVHAELDTRRPGVEAEDDAFVALTHESGVRSHLLMSLVSARETYRYRLIGERGMYVKTGVDVQEAALRAGERPTMVGWGIEPESQWGTLYVGDEERRMPSEAGNYIGFYAGVAMALTEGAPPPVEPADAVHVLEVIDAAKRAVREEAPVVVVA